MTAVTEPPMAAEPSRRGRLVVLISGNGSNLQAVLDACADDDLKADVVAVVSDRRAAFGLRRALGAGVPTEVLTYGKFKRNAPQPRLAYDHALADIIDGYNPDLIVFAGFMRIVSAALIARFSGRIINLHPALPGAFPGTHAIERALAAWQSGHIEHTGVMVHHVIAAVDAGAAIAVAKVPFITDDDLDSLSARIHAVEHRLLVDAITKVLPTIIAAHSSNPRELP